MPTRRDFYRLGTVALGALMTVALAVPGVGYLLNPLLKERSGGGAGGDDAEDFVELTRLSELEVGVPQAFTVEASRQDAWVRYPREPIGVVWLIRQAEGASPQVVALSAECPHLGCGINLAADRRGFSCPCHHSTFTLEGRPNNDIPPRPMDTLVVDLAGEDDPLVRVKFQRFRTLTKEKIPLA